jgi:hypothetical protein
VTHRTGSARPAARLDAVARRGEEIRREIESEIERRNASSYNRAAPDIANTLTE